MTLTFKKIFGVMVMQQLMFRLISRRAGSRLVAHAFSTPRTLATFRPFHASVLVRASAVEEDLDSALENILGEAFPEPKNGVETKVAKKTLVRVKQESFVFSGRPAVLHCPPFAKLARIFSSA